MIDCMTRLHIKRPFEKFQPIITFLDDYGRTEYLHTSCNKGIQIQRLSSYMKLGKPTYEYRRWLV